MDINTRIIKQTPCSAELISTAYQPWNSVFLSQQISHSRLISQKNSLPNRAKIYATLALHEKLLPYHPLLILLNKIFYKLVVSIVLELS
jgi:hypothetical protein